jgi:hypothetical protein
LILPLIFIVYYIQMNKKKCKSLKINNKKII